MTALAEVCALRVPFYFKISNGVCGRPSVQLPRLLGADSKLGLTVVTDLQLACCCILIVGNAWRWEIHIARGWKIAARTHHLGNYFFIISVGHSKLLIVQYMRTHKSKKKQEKHSMSQRFSCSVFLYATASQQLVNLLSLSSLQGR